MLSDYELCTQLCTQRGISPPIEILDAMKIGSSMGELCLNSLTIVVPVCEIIGRVLASSTTIKSVNLSDCMLVSKGLGKILEALHDGSNITSLNLKGNNISGSIASQLGDIFYHNNTLKYLHIEWNALGTDTESFEKFCKGLCVNHNIEEIDLRYNQINPYCAEALSVVLKKSKSLKIINLAWNSLGVQGGQLILDGMKENSCIIQLDLRGNWIPMEMIEAIDNCTYTNQSKRIISQTNISKAIDAAKLVVLHDNSHEVALTNSEGAVDKELFVIEKLSKIKLRKSELKNSAIIDQTNKNNDENCSNVVSINSVMSSSDKEYLDENDSKDIADSQQNIPIDKSNSKENELNKKISDINKILQDRTAAINILTNEISLKNSEIKAAKLESDQLKIEINTLKNEQEKILLDHIKEIDEIKLSHKYSEEIWSKTYRELEQSYNILVNKNKEWETKARCFERDIHRSSLEIISLREKWMSKSQSYDDLIAKSKTELHRAKRELQEKESRHKIELNLLKNTLKETTEALEECQSQLQKLRLELRETSVNFSNTKLKLSEMEHINVKYIRLDECLQKMKEEKTILDEKLIDSQRTIASLKRQVTTLQNELIEPQRHYNLLKDQLNNEKEKSTRLKQELSEERARIKEQDAQMQIMNSQITLLNTQINDNQKTYTDDIRERDKENKQLKEIIVNKERTFNDLKAEEAQRASQLYAAFSKYLSSIGHGVNL